MTRRNHEERLKEGRYKRWIELDPQQSKVWRFAWDLLLENKPDRSLEDICEALHAQGYTLRSGTPFVKIGSDGKRIHNRAVLSRVFHNPFYAGLIYLHDHFDELDYCIIQGDWPSIVTPQEFAQGEAILKERDQSRNHYSKNFYLLKHLIHLQQENGEIRKLTCSTPNANRKGGGTSYYCIPSSDLNFICSDVDEQIEKHLHDLRVAPDLLEKIRTAYTAELNEKFDTGTRDQQQRLTGALEEIQREEVRGARLYATGKISEDVYDELWREWQDRRTKIEAAMRLGEEDAQQHIITLDAALLLIAKTGILFNKLDLQGKRELLLHLMQRVIINSKGTILRVDLRTPFSYLNNLIREMNGSTLCFQDSMVDSQTETGGDFSACSKFDSLSGPSRIRTCNQPVMSRSL
jgi:hypothetical protein